MTFKPHHNVLDGGHKAILYLNLIYTILKNASVLYIGGSAVLPSAFSKLLLYPCSSVRRPYSSQTASVSMHSSFLQTELCTMYLLESGFFL